jgi:TolB-like protein/tetratricopeptide (TPR) repeat protein
MASLIPGFEYDIFISYRQKDNKGDRWVSEFVEALKTELESTFKEEVSVYFDINPHDGLLETHEVGASLEEKLKCLIFIPIISQTYCDPKSFAWKYELCTFNKLAKEDQIGRNIRLSGGNVASRILPVKIHDLDPEDKMLLENELGGVLRGIEFIYKSAGVNRPLRANEDHPHDNLNKTYYRDQINKVANAVKEIINALKKPQRQSAEGSKEIIKQTYEPSKSLKSKILIGALLVIALIIIGYFFIPKLTKSNNQVEKSIAVLPFMNDSPDQENTYFINGIMEEILNNLQKIKNLRVLSRTSTDQYRGSSRPTIPEIAKKLGVNYILEGSGQKYGNTFRLRVQLIAANNEKHIWGKSFEQEIREIKDIFRIQSLIAQSIAEGLNTTITPEEKQMIEKTPTSNLTAYDFYQRGKDELAKDPWPEFNPEAVRRAESLFRRALEYDSTYAKAYSGLGHSIWIKLDRDHSITDSNIRNKLTDSLLVLSDIALSYDDKLAEAYIIRASYYGFKGSVKQEMEEWDKAIRYNPNDWNAYFLKGTFYEDSDVIKSLENYQKAASLNHDRQIINILTDIGGKYYQYGFPEKGDQFFREALELDEDSAKYLKYFFHFKAEQKGDYKTAVEYYEKLYLKDTTNPELSAAIGHYYAFLGKNKESFKYFEKYISALKAKEQSDPPLDPILGYVYIQNGHWQEAEYYFSRQIETLSSNLRTVQPWDRIYSVYPLAGIYAFNGEKDSAYKYLNIFKQYPNPTLYWWLTSIKNDPLFNGIRNEPDFQKIVRDIETNYQADHERIRKWLEEQGEL